MSMSAESIWGWLHALKKKKKKREVCLMSLTYCGYTDVKLTPCWNCKVQIDHIPADESWDSVFESDISVFCRAVILNRTALIAPNQKHFKAATCPLYCLLARVGVQRMCFQSFGSVFTWSQCLNTNRGPPDHESAATWGYTWGQHHCQRHCCLSHTFPPQSGGKW